MSDAKNPAPRPAIGPLASVPVFWKVGGKRVLLAGGGDGLVWKAELLAAAQARLDLYCPDPPDHWKALAASLPRVSLRPRRWMATDFRGATLAIGDFGSDAEAAEFAVAARGAGVPVNVVDRREFCDFEFGALVDRSPLLVAISTDGAAPVLAQALRGRIEALLPEPIRDWAKSAQLWRPLVQERWSDRRRRRQFWEFFAREALDNPHRPPSDADRDRLFERAGSVSPSGDAALTIIGAGPGDPELLTLRGLRALLGAEALVYEDGVAAEIVALSRREARRYSAREAQQLAPDATGISPSALAGAGALARQGKNTVFLVAGDPRGDKALAAGIDRLIAVGLSVELVAGVQQSC